MSAFGRLPSEQQQQSQSQSNRPLNATHVAEHLLPLFEYAATIIPTKYYESTQVKYQATAGMRLLEESEQEAIYDALYQGLLEAPTFVFRGMKRHDIATLGGDLEGFYGAVAANYLEGIIDANMRLVHQEGRDNDDNDNDDDDDNNNDSSISGPIGALDMGGSSTQIVFLSHMHGEEEEEEQPQTCSSQQEECQDSDIVSHLDVDKFFTTSYLSYGVDQFRERLWTTLVQERLEEDWMTPDSCASKFIRNPCANKGYQTEWDGFTLVGTGDTEECIRQVRRLIPHPEIPLDDHNYHGVQVGGVEHPPVRGRFFAMSLYFFTLDSLRVLSHPKQDAHIALNLSWPNPSIEELHNALDGLCSRSWEGDLEDIQHNSHEFTRAEVLPHRCLESVYMVTLLKDGFGFHPKSRDITFTFLVDGSEVEWSLGMALALHAEEMSMDSPSRKKRGVKHNNSTSQDENDDHNDEESHGGTPQHWIMSQSAALSSAVFAESL